MSLGETLYAQADRADEFTELTEETLAGKKIGVSRMNTGDIVFRKILRDRGVDLSKIEFVELDSQATVTEAVVKGEVDLGINFLTFRETAEAQGLVPISQLDAEDEWPNYICCRMFTTREKLEENREAYVRALKANIKAYELIQTDHEKTLELATENYDIDEEILENEIYGYGHLGLSPNPDALNTSEFYQAMVDTGYAEGNVDISDYIDTSLYIEALDELLAEDPDNEVYLELKAESDATNY
jgi:NitT/TauT family transport system substrate-binding protein